MYSKNGHKWHKMEETMKNEKITLTREELEEFKNEIIEELRELQPKITKEEIMKVKDIAQRQKLISQNLHLFNYEEE